MTAIPTMQAKGIKMKLYTKYLDDC